MRDEDHRPDPDALLAEVRRAEGTPGRGRLHLFLGMCPGVGKTYAMLQAARKQVEDGEDVLIGVVETHGRAETAELLEGLKVIPPKTWEYRDVAVSEFDLDGVLARRPRIVLVDELAHTNAPGSRHAKRYQDVLELIEAGIDVYSTLNVQHIESQVDIVRQITGVSVHETVPDSILDEAHEIQLIDLSVEKLLERMGEGKVYLGERAERAVEGFFKEGNLTALRELALRFTAEQVDRDLEDIRRAKRVSSPWKTNARLMVGIGPSPYAESLVRWTRRAATRINCPWLVVWVEGSQPPSPADQERIARSLGLARKLGGEVVLTTGDDVAEALLRVAHERNVTQIVVGKPDRRVFWKLSLADRIIRDSGDIDVCVARPLAGREVLAGSSFREAAPVSVIGEYSWVAAILFVVVSLCWAAVPYTGYMFVALVFLFAVVLAALRFRRGPVIAMAALSALTWNFLFIPPRFTFWISKVDDAIMFALFFVVAIAMGSLTHRLRTREEAERRRRRQTETLFRVTQSAALSPDYRKGLVGSLRLIDEMLGVESVIFPRLPDRSLSEHPIGEGRHAPSGKERGVALWCFGNRQIAGRFTDTLPESSATWFPLQTATSMMGVLGIRFPTDAILDFASRQMIEGLALQLAMVLEKQHFIEAVNEAEVLSRSEELHRSLLDCVSHELRTPLAVIRAALDGIGERGDPYLAEIETAAVRLQRVIDSLLQMSGIESDVLSPSRDWCDLQDVVQSAVKAAGSGLASHELSVSIPEDFPLFRTDHRLLAQALANILHNAGVYAPPGTPIEVTAVREGDGLRLIVRDHGPGLPPGEERRVFAKFYRPKGSPAGGTGLGLAISRGFISALGGAVEARNHPASGAEFSIHLPNAFHEGPDHR
ncbi:MAG: sensor histidine kinase KdpD [Verrucomicrobiales bacterium]|nr:sensor histidine kinase KdpD [Verrucomicrobiales bacterium]